MQELRRVVRAEKVFYFFGLDLGSVCLRGIRSTNGLGIRYFEAKVRLRELFCFALFQPAAFDKPLQTVQC